MSQNDRALLDRLIEEYTKARFPEAPPAQGEIFLRFTVEQVLRQHALDDEEIGAGITEHADDGGIDAFYWLVDGRAASFRTEPNGRVKELRVIALQSKHHSRFEEQPLKNIRETVVRLLSLPATKPSAPERYSPRLSAISASLREFIDENLTSIDKVIVSVFYASRGSDPSPGVLRQADELAEAISNLGSLYEGDVRLVGASDLVQMTRWTPTTTFSLRTPKWFALGDEKNASYVCLLRLGEYFRLVAEKDGTVRQDLLDENVRDHLGTVTVNRAIRATLSEKQGPDFWWLNNGVTIIADSVTTAGEQLKLASPRIVNGLQTTHELVRYFREEGQAEEDPRHVLARIVVIDDDEVRDRIIAATNQQSPVPAAQLWATRTIHRNLEDYFLSHGYFYERRKNKYKNERRPISRIFSIAQVGQALMATLVGRPHDARARPSSLLDSEDAHDRIFNDKTPLDAFLKAARLVRSVDTWLTFEPKWLHQEEEQAVMREAEEKVCELLFPASYVDRTNLRFFVAFTYVRLAALTMHPAGKDIAALQLERIDIGAQVKAVDLCWRAFLAAGRTDKSAKGQQLFDEVIARLRKELPSEAPVN